MVNSGGKPFRLTETNSCYGGGQPDVSDAFASALWGADMMLKTAAAGYVGVNLHSGGDGYYTPIAVGGDGRAELRPLYYGMQLAQLFSGANCSNAIWRRTPISPPMPGEKAKRCCLRLSTRGSDAVDVSLDWAALHGRTMTRAYALTAPGLDAKSGVSFPRLPPLGPTGSIPGYRATAFVWTSANCAAQRNPRLLARMTATIQAAIATAQDGLVPVMGGLQMVNFFRLRGSRPLRPARWHYSL